MPERGWGRSPIRRGVLPLALLVLAAALVVAMPGWAAGTPTTRRVSVASDGSQGNGQSGNSRLSADGRFVVFDSFASNLVGNDTNGLEDVFIRDRVTARTRRVSLSSTGGEGNGYSVLGSISPDARFVTFASEASNLVANDTNGVFDVFVRDRSTGKTRRVSLGSTGGEGNDDSARSSISADGRFVAFYSFASNLVDDDANGVSDIFVRDRATGKTTRISVDPSGIDADGGSFDVSISASGRFVAFESLASNLVRDDVNGSSDVFVRDRATGRTRLVSINSAGAEGNGDSASPRISTGGRFVAFTSDASNLVAFDGNGSGDVFIRDRLTGKTRRVSVNSEEVQGNGDSLVGSVTPDGRFVAFSSRASNLVGIDTNGWEDMFVRDRSTGKTRRVSGGLNGTEANDASSDGSLSADGLFVAFSSYATNLVGSDTNARRDVFVRGPLG
jgi:hypothetical protein